jgi:hypothetical protein
MSCQFAGSGRAHNSGANDHYVERAVSQPAHDKSCEDLFRLVQKWLCTTAVRKALLLSDPRTTLLLIPYKEHETAGGACRTTVIPVMETLVGSHVYYLIQ